MKYKNSLLILINLVIYYKVFGQDQITQRNGKIINCKITSIDTSKIEVTLNVNSNKEIKSFIDIPYVSDFTFNGITYILNNLDKSEINSLIKNIKLCPEIPINITKIETWSQIATGNGALSPKNGFRYFVVYMTIYNNLKTKLSFDLKQMYLLDSVSKTKYKVEEVLANSIFNIGLSKNRKLDPGEINIFKVVFECPDNFIPQKILVYDKIIDVPTQ